MRHVAYAAAAAAALGLAISQAAVAADMPVKAPVHQAAPAAYNWSGFYVGVNAGWAGQDFDWSFNPGLPGQPHQAYSLDQDTWIGGFHFGLQWQFGQVVAGLEVASSLLGNSHAIEIGFGNNPNINSRARIDSLITAGARIGWTPFSNWLLFATGGYARGDVQTDAFNPVTNLPVLPTEVRHEGWYAGGGIEYAVTQYLIFGVEYQYVDLGSKFHCVACVPPGINDRDLDATMDIVRARLSVKISP